MRIAEDGAARVRAARIDGDDANVQILLAVHHREAVDERAFPHPGTAGHADDVRLPCLRKELTQNLEARRGAVFDVSDHARQRANFALEELIQEGCGHARTVLRRASGVHKP